MSTSVRADRFLRELGVSRALERGDRYFLVGPLYVLRADAETEIRLIFRGRSPRTVEIGYASRQAGGRWIIAECEPYTMRSLGYYQRRLKRIGDWHSNPPAEGYLELEAIE